MKRTATTCPQTTVALREWIESPKTGSASFRTSHFTNALPTEFPAFNHLKFRLGHYSSWCRFTIFLPHCSLHRNIKRQGKRSLPGFLACANARRRPSQPYLPQAEDTRLCKEAGSQSRATFTKASSELHWTEAESPATVPTSTLGSPKPDLVPRTGGLGISRGHTQARINALRTALFKSSRIRRTVSLGRG